MVVLKDLLSLLVRRSWMSCWVIWLWVGLASFQVGEVVSRKMILVLLLEQFIWGGILLGGGFVAVHLLKITSLDSERKVYLSPHSCSFI